MKSSAKFTPNKAIKKTPIACAGLATSCSPFMAALGARNNLQVKLYEYKNSISCLNGSPIIL